MTQLFLKKCLTIYTFILLNLQSKWKTLSLISFSDDKYTKKPNTLISLILNNLLVLNSTSVLTYVAIEVFLISPPAQDFCRKYHFTKIICYGTSMLTVYTILWLRVFRVFYSHKMARRFTGAFARVFNIASVTLLLICLIANFSVFLSGPLYSNAEHGCRSLHATKLDSLKWVILGGSSTVCRFAVLTSLAYPLYLHRRRMLGSGIQTKQANVVIPLIKRAACMTLICVMCDTTASTLVAVSKPTLVYQYHIELSTNLLVNNFCIIFSSANWRRRLFPYLICARCLSTHNRRKPSAPFVHSRKQQQSFASLSKS